MDPALAKALNEMAVTVITTVLIPLIVWGFKLFRAWGNAHVAAVKDDNMRKALEFALTRLDQTAQTVVDELNQTDKRISADGKIEPGEAKLLLRKAYNRLLNRLPLDATAILQNAFGDKLQSVMVGKIESKVAGAKS